MLHYIGTNEAASASQARLTMHRNGALCGLTYGQKFLENGIAGRAAIDKEQILVIETGILKG